MSLIVSAPEGGSKWPLLEAGTYPAVCTGIIDIGEHDNPMYATSARKVIIMWEMALLAPLPRSSQWLAMKLSCQKMP